MELAEEVPVEPEARDSEESSSDSESEGEGGLEGGLTKPGREPLAGGGLEMEPDEELVDSEMYSAVASASHQASKFLQDFDSDGEADRPKEVEELRLDSYS